MGKNKTAGILFVDKKGRVLTMPRIKEKTGKKVGGDDIPKGNVDKGEKPKQAAKRETKEETGIKAKKIEKIGKVPFSKNKDLHLYVQRLKKSDEIKNKNVKFKNPKEIKHYSKKLRKAMKKVHKKIKAKK